MKARGIRFLTQDERGNALVLSLMILTALSSVGVLALQRTASDLQVSTNISRQSQALMASEAGLIHGIALVGFEPSNYAKLIKANMAANPGAGDSYKVQAISTANSNYANRMPVVGGMGSQWSRIPQDLGYDVTIYFYKSAECGGGFQVDSGMECLVFDSVTQGAVPTGVQSGGQSMDQTLFQSDTMVVKSVARFLAGPVHKL